MLPRLEAEEQLAAINAHALGNVSLKKHDRNHALRELEKRRRPSQAGKAAKANPRALGAMGIGVVTVPARAAEKVLSDG